MKKLAYVLLSFLMGLAAAGIPPAQQQEDPLALLIAALHGHSDIVDKLLAAGANVNAADELGYTPLLIAALHGHSDIVAKLLAAGADVDKADVKGTTPLMRAVQAGHSDIVDKLLAAGADVNRADAEDFTPLMEAALHGHSDIVAKLLDKGADQTMQSRYGTALDLAKTDDIKKLIRENIERKREAVSTALGELHYIPKDIAGEIESFTF